MCGSGGETRRCPSVPRLPTMVEIPQHISAELAEKAQAGDYEGITDGMLSGASKAELLAALAIASGEFDVEYNLHDPPSSITINHEQLAGIVRALAAANRNGEADD